MIFLYICNEWSKSEIQKIVLLTTASKRLKYLEINLTEEVKDTENYKISLKATKEDLNNWNVHELEDLILLRSQYCPNLSIDSVHSLSKLQLPFLGQKSTNWS